MDTRLMRSREERWIAGVAGGISRYLGVDPMITRLVFLVLGFEGVGILIYIVLWLVMPREPNVQPYVSGHAPQPPESTGEIPVRTIRPTTGQRKGTLGMVLIIIGIFLFLSNTVPWIDSYGIPLLLIIAGLLLIGRAGRKDLGGIGP